MVIKDPFSQDNHKTAAVQTKHEQAAVDSSQSPYQLANPLDRAAAAVLDIFVVLSPFILVVIAPFRKELTRQSLIGDNFATIMAAVAMLVLVFVVVLLYQTVMTWLFGGTLGKILFGLRVRKIWSAEHPTLLDSFLRSIIWQLEVLAVGVPFLAALINEKRRVLHDRVCDTIVVTTKRGQHVGAPNFVEVSFAKGLLALAAGTFSVLFVVYVMQVYKEVESQSRLAHLLENEGTLCPSVGQAFSDWQSHDDNEAGRLEVAMALFAAGEIDESCLDQEAQWIFNSGYETPLAYLAKSFVHSGERELSDSYLKKVCELDEKSVHCVMSHMISQWAAAGDFDLSTDLEDRVGTGSEYLGVWATRQMIRFGRYDEAVKILDKLGQQSSLSNFLSSHRVMAYWGQKRTLEAKAAAEALLQGESNPHVSQMASWLCLQSLGSSCDGEFPLACSNMEASGQSRGYDSSDVVANLAHLKVLECHDQKDVDYQGLALSIPNVEVRRLAFAESLKAIDKKLATSELQDLIVNDRTDVAVKAEAVIRLLPLATDRESLEKLSRQWTHLEPGVEWEWSGLRLFEDLRKKQLIDPIILVGERLFSMGALSEDQSQWLAVAAHSAGHVKLATQLVEHLENEVRGEKVSRSLASVKAYEQVKRQVLRSKGMGQ